MPGSGMEVASLARTTTTPRMSAARIVSIQEVLPSAFFLLSKVLARVHMKNGIMMLQANCVGRWQLSIMSFVSKYVYKVFRSFTYGGCLGNGNRFMTKEECESLCWPRPEIPVCSKPKAEGACLGDHPRWFYDKEAGECQEFSFTGCRGNNNRFMTKEACTNTCRHAAIRRKTDITCQQYIDEGNCEGGDNSTIARWGYHQFTKR